MISLTGPSSARPMPTQQPDVGQALTRLLLTEMLKSTDLAQSRGFASGGIGEEQFSSFLLDEYAATLSTALKIDMGRLSK